MRRRPDHYNLKRKLDRAVDADVLREWLDRVRYSGNPEHKRNPGDFGLTPPASPRPDKQLCDRSGVFERAVAEHYLAEGVRRGMVSAQRVAGLPQNIWAVMPDGVVLEAQLDNREQATYHGYPLAEHDPFGRCVRDAWGGDDA